jgi:uncharacterized protein YfaS (alpha-2-macroglobulin family)
MVEVYERGNTIYTEMEFKSDGVLTDPYNNAVYVTIYRPDGTPLIDNQPTERESVGKYYYYFNTEEDDLLGLYIIHWYAQHSIGGSFGFKPIVQREVVSIVDTQH